MIVLLFNAGPLDVTWAKLSPHVHAMLECFFPAQATGDALYQTLLAKSADAVPGGRLPATWPAYISQVRMMIHVCMQGSHGGWKTWKMKMVMEKSWNMTNWLKVMEFYQFCHQIVCFFATTKKLSMDVKSPHFLMFFTEHHEFKKRVGRGIVMKKSLGKPCL